MRLLVGNIVTQVVQGGKDNLLEVSPEVSIKEYLSYKVDGYQFSQAYRKRRWDGKKSMLKYGKFPTGMLPFVVKHLKEIGVEVVLEDARVGHPVFKGELITDFEGWKLMEHQKEVGNLIGREVEGIPFYRGIVNAATNAGKTLVIAGIHENLLRPWTILVVDTLKTYQKTVEEFSEWFEVGEISGSKYDLKPFTVAMVKTLSNSIKKSVNVKQDMKKFKVYMVDECHSAGNATHCHVAASLTEAAVRVYFSGTPLDTQNKEHNLKLIGNSGNIIKSISNKEMMDKGISLKVRVHIMLNRQSGNCLEVTEAYDKYVVYSEFRMQDMVQIIGSIQKGKQILVSFKYHRHGEYLLKELQEYLPNVKMGMVHGDTANSSEQIEEFKNMNIQVLIASTILKQAVNIPCIEVIINAMGGKDKTTIKQFLGRGIRLNGDNTHLDYYDWFDDGNYVGRHSRARIKIYKQEEFEINFNYTHNSQYSPKYI